jgi:hypothetical protein
MKKIIIPMQPSLIILQFDQNCVLRTQKKFKIFKTIS